MPEHNGDSGWWPRYCASLEDPRWIALRNARFALDGHACVDCGSEDRLEAHHLRYAPSGLAYDSPVKDLRTLCKGCHGERKLWLKTADELLGRRILAEAVGCSLGRKRPVLLRSDGITMVLAAWEDGAEGYRLVSGRGVEASGRLRLAALRARIRPTIHGLKPGEDETFCGLPLGGAEWEWGGPQDVSCGSCRNVNAFSAWAKAWPHAAAV